MGAFDKINKIAKRARETVKSDAGNKHWEQQDLDKLEKTVKQNANWNKEKSKSGWTNPQTGQKFSAEHYKNNYDNDKKAIERIKAEKNKRKLYLKGKAMSDTYYKLKKRDKTDSYLED